MLFPTGKYAATVAVQNTEWGPMSCVWAKAGTGTNYVIVQFEVLRGPMAGRRISWFGYLTEATEERTFKGMRLCGFAGDDLDQFCDQRPENEVEIVVEHSEYKGKVSAKVAWINDPASGIKVEDPIRDKELRRFSAQFKARLKSLPAVAGIKAVREAPSAAPAAPSDTSNGGGWGGAPNDEEGPPARPPSDDDIPF
jgi:hypothetical protein